MAKYNLQIKLIPCLDDNYAVLAHDPETKLTLLVDAPVSAVILETLEENGWKLSHILLTHHHHDHIGGLAAIRSITGAKVYGPAVSQTKVPSIDEGLADGDTFHFGDIVVHALATPGHTLDHISYWLPDAELAFTGDTLFAMGCGRVFEGSLQDMWLSLNKLAKLPPETTIYCGHEYTEANGNFCLSIEPGNELLKQRVQDVKALRAKGLPTLPTTILEEMATNSFLRASVPQIKAAVGMPDAPDSDVFAELRTRKDAF